MIQLMVTKNLIMYIFGCLCRGQVVIKTKWWDFTVLRSDKDNLVSRLKFQSFRASVPYT